MDKPFGRIPPLSALRGFEAAARHGSFSRAADELNMTQSAISHQIKSLEMFFGQPLFKRVGRSVQLTDAGDDFLETAGKSLEFLARGTRRLDSYLKPNSVIITTSPAFANKWLIPRFSDLQKMLPDLQPWLHTTDEHSELEHAELDIAIWRGRGNWQGLKSVKLFDDVLVPVCAPGYIPAQENVSLPQDFAGCNLLHDERREDWHTWFRQQRIERTDIKEGFNFSDSGLLIDSAVAGQGIALASLVLADHKIGDGSLTRPAPQVLNTKEAYFAVCVEMHLLRPAVKSMWEWIIEQGEKFNKELQTKIGYSNDGYPRHHQLTFSDS